MRDAYKVLIITGAALLAAAAVSSPAISGNTGPLRVLSSKGMHALRDWDYQEAERISREMFDKADEDDPEEMATAHMFEARYCFYIGDYTCARNALERREELDGLDQDGREFYQRIKTLQEAWEGAKEKSSGHFHLRYAEPRDEVVVEPALETLERAYRALTSDLGFEPRDPVLVEVYPDFDAFTSGTGIDKESLEKSGTIAVCKYRRLMVNSPRTLLRGYSYRDTLSHEFVHLLIYHRFGRSIPIWLHEGIAKYEEERWRNDRGGTLTPSQESLLASALRQEELITFERMHPSFAYLETPRQGQLAFSEVTSVVDYMVSTGGWDMVMALCEEISKGSGYRKAVSKVTGMSFETFWQNWIAYAERKGYEELPGMEITVHEIRKGDMEFEQVDEEVDESDMSESEHWRYVRLGDLLRDRGHYSAALVEYTRAKQMNPYSPKMLNKLGLCHLLAGQYKEAMDPLRQGVELFPGYSTTYINLGRALYAAEDYEGAVSAMQQALDINPFNPVAYNYLMKVYQQKGDQDKVKEYRRKLMLISG